MSRSRKHVSASIRPPEPPGDGLWPPPRWRPHVLLAALALLAYSNSFLAPFVFDGLNYVENNPAVQSVWPPWQPMAEGSRPLVMLTFAWNYALHGTSVFGYHLVNWGIHLIAGWALLEIAYFTLTLPKLRGRYGRHALWLAAGIAGLWMLHPLQTQSVTYLYQRYESLMGMFFLLAFWAALWGENSPHRGRWQAAAVICCFCSVACKEVAIAAPFLLLWYDRVFLADNWPEVWQRRWRLHAGMFASWGLLAWLMWRTRTSYVAAGLMNTELMPTWPYARSQPYVIWRYLRLTFWPQGQSLDYMLEPLSAPSQYLPPMAALAVVLLATLWAVFRRPRWGFLGGWFFLILAPTSSVFPIVDLVFEHRMYLSLAAVAAAVVLGGCRLWQSLAARDTAAGPGLARGLVAALIGAVLTLGVVTFLRNLDYITREAVYRDILAKRPGRSYRALHGLGHAYMMEEQFEEAIPYLREAVQVRPEYWPAQAALVESLIRAGRPEEALAHYRQQIDHAPPDPVYRFNLANLHEQFGTPEEAAAYYRECLEHHPRYTRALDALAMLHFRQQEYEQAEALFRHLTEISPDSWQAQTRLAICLFEQGERAAAFDVLRKLIAQQPNLPDAHAALAQALHRDGQTTAAIEHCRTALRLRPDWPQMQAELARMTTSPSSP